MRTAVGKKELKTVCPQVYALQFQGGYPESSVRPVSRNMLQANIVYPRIRMLSLAGRMGWVHVQHPDIDDNRQQAAANQFYTSVPFCFCLVLLKA